MNSAASELQEQGEHAVPVQQQNDYNDQESLAIIREQREKRVHLGALTVVRAARRERASVEWLGRFTGWIILNDRRVPISSHFGPESAVGAAIVDDKQITKDLLIAAGVSVPDGREVNSADEAVAAQRELNTGVVIKPLNGAMGNGVTVNVTDPADIREGYERARKYGRRILVEQFVNGFEYRVHATPEKCTGVFRRLLPSVMGDGRSTVAELVAQKNEARKANPTTRHMPILMDEVATGLLRRGGLNWSSVPQPGQQVIVRDVNGITSGGDSEGCFDSVDPRIKQTAVDAVAAIPGMAWAGVDLLVDEITGQPYVIEMNTNASIDGSNFPVYGPPRDMGAELWRALYAHTTPEPTAVPIGLQLNSRPEPLLEDSPAGGARQVTLTKLFQDYLRGQGYEVTQHNARLWTAESVDGTGAWFAGPTSIRDSRVANQVMRRRGAWLRALAKQGIPRLHGRVVRNVDELDAFRNEFGTDVTLLPYGIHAGTGFSIIIGKEAAASPGLFNRRKNWYAQVRRSGQRLRVVATPEKALVALSKQELTLSDQELQAVTRLAVRATRALPQMRWAAVDIVIRTPDRVGPQYSGVYVEETSFHPYFEPNDQVVAGSMADLYEVLLQGSGS